MKVCNLNENIKKVICYLNYDLIFKSDAIASL